MRPTIHPQLINDPFGDPGLFVDFLFERRAMLFDLGDLAPLPSRRLLRVSHAFVSHAHMDHFVGFDSLLRNLLGRDKSIALAGPPGFIDRVSHKLSAYTWNLVRTYEGNLQFDVSEIHPDGRRAAARLESKSAFEPQPVDPGGAASAAILDDGFVSIRAAVLDHQTPCLAFALEEKCHVNIWRNRLEAEGLPVGPWLHELKGAVIADAADDTPIRVRWKRDGATRERELALGVLKERVLTVEPGLSFGYVVDALYHPDNVRRIVDLARGVDILFIEAPFLDADSAIAARKFHLTARQAGEIARLAGVKRVVPFHFSPRYSGRGDEILREAQNAFSA